MTWTKGKDGEMEVWGLKAIFPLGELAKAAVAGMLSEASISGRLLCRLQTSGMRNWGGGGGGQRSSQCAKESPT